MAVFGIKQAYLLVGSTLTIIPSLLMITPFISWMISFLVGYVYVSMGNNNWNYVLIKEFFFHIALTAAPVFMIGPMGVMDEDKIQKVIIGCFYIFGLHFTYLDNIDAFRKFVLKPSAILNWSWKQWLIFSFFLLL